MHHRASGGPRLKREIKTIQVMFQLYCRRHHRSAGLCPECATNLDYSLKRTLMCPFGEEKGPCRDCSIHCYRQPWKDEIRRVMVWAGPRMIFRHPWLALAHLLDGWRRRRLGTRRHPAAPVRILPID